LAAVILPPLLFFAIFLFTSLVSHLQDSSLLACGYVPSGIEPIDHDDDSDDDQEVDQLAADTADQSEQPQDYKDHRYGPE
jgi:hypothetical protein